jgi:hypothetical protein
MSTKIQAFYDLADCPEDGGKHALYCDHDFFGCGVLQHTNKRQLLPWLKATEEWCPLCQTEAAQR